VAIVCATCLLAGVIFWPTLYRHDTVRMEDATFPLRINRLTGRTEMFVGLEWIQAGSDASSDDQSTDLPSNEAAKVTGNGALTGYGWFSGKVYNGSSWTVTGLVISVSAKERDGSVRWTREFNVRVSAQPLSTGSLNVEVVDDNGVGSTDWAIVRVRGVSGNK
jgi:hypothetical protein